MNEYLRTKLRALSFFLVILVVFVHSYNINVKLNTGEDYTTSGMNSFLQNFFSQGMNRIASPLFFIISGYLFFVNISGNPDEFIRKLKKRFKTLIIPYLFWSVWGILFYTFLQSFPLSKTFFTTELIKEYSFQKLMNTIFLNPIPYQLWYVRDLSVFVILSPIIYLIIRYFKIWAVFVCMFIWFYDFNFILFRSQSLFFFILGGLISKNNEKLLNPELSRKSLIFVFLWIAFVFCRTTLVYVGFQNLLIINVIHKISILMGIAAINNLYDILFKNVELTKSIVYKMVTYTFFIFVFHEPIITIFIKGLFFVIGKGEIESFIIYLIAPLLTISISLYVGSNLKKITPKFYGTITGWR